MCDATDGPLTVNEHQQQLEAGAHCLGFVTMTNIKIIRWRSMRGSPVAWTHSKHGTYTDWFILVQASEPYVQQYNDLLITNAQSEFSMVETKRDW
jgi:hypothetical protein